MGVNWEMINDRIHWVDLESDVTERPSAIQVLHAVDAKKKFSQESHSLEDDLGLAFSRFPIEPTVLLTGDNLDNLKAQIGFYLNSVFQPINTVDDQYIIDRIWVPAHLEEVQRYFDLLSDASIPIDGSLTIPKLLRLRADLSRYELQNQDQIHISTEAIAASAFDRVAHLPGLNAQLYQYQEVGLAYLASLADHGIGSLLGDEMGLGKTLQAIGLVVYEAIRNKGLALVICPASLIENWKREFAKFAPGLIVLVHTGPTRTGTPRGLEKQDVVVTSYETLVRDEVIFNQVFWNLCVLDEAQNIKNSRANRTEVVKRLKRNLSLAVTGTPVENRLADLWSISDFILPGYLGDEDSFQTNFSDDLEDAERLAKIMKPLVLRRKIESVANELPERLEIVLPVDVAPRQAAHYEELRQSSQNAEKSKALATLVNLRMSTASVFELPRNQTTTLTAKASHLVELLSEVFLNGNKAVIFASFKNTIDDLKTLLESRWPTNFFAVIDGRTPVVEREEILDDFRNSPNQGALILNPRAAGVGLNIEAANFAIHYNPEWNPAVTAQASARVYRRTQTRPVTIYHLLCANTVEEVIRERSEFKSSLAQSATLENQGEQVQSEVLIRALAVSPVGS